MKLSHPVVDLCIVCSNFEESLTFYRDKLGFEVALDIDIPEDLATGIGLAPQGFRQVRLQMTKKFCASPRADLGFDNRPRPLVQ